MIHSTVGTAVGRGEEGAARRGSVGVRGRASVGGRKEGQTMRRGRRGRGEVGTERGYNENGYEGEDICMNVARGGEGSE